MKKNTGSFLKRWAVLVFLTGPFLSWAQEERDLGPVSRTYAITQINIIQAPGRKVDRGTVVIKDGLIKAVGKDIPIPPEAVIIKADNMYVYAGFIDGLSRIGVTKPKEETKEKVKDPGNPPPERAGITPEADVRSFLNPSEKLIEEYRAIGFTVSHVVPAGKMLPGTGAIILLGGNSVDNMVLVPKSSLYSEFTPADRIYPATVIGVMAKWRELYRQALLAKSYEALYASNRTGVERPHSNRILEAFYPVIDKRSPVLFLTPKILDAQRAIALQADLGFPLILGDLKEGWDIIPKIKASSAKVFLSLELPEEKKPDKKKDTLSAASQGKEGSPVDAARNDLERKALETRKEEFIGKYVAQPFVFQKEGVVFGFSTLAAKVTDVQPNLRRMIKAGLTEDQALAALTTSPAQLLGLSDRLGTIDNGKIANLVISDKPYFQESAKVRYVFVDGIPYKIDAAKPAADTSTPPAVAGSWTVNIETPQGKSEEKLLLKKEGAGYTGNLSGGQLPEPVNLQSVAVEGKILKYKYMAQMSGTTHTVEVDAVVEGEIFKGNASVGQLGNFPVEGKKDPNH